MKLTIYAIGRLKSSPEQQMIGEYLKRMGGGSAKRCGLSVPVLNEQDSPKGVLGETLKTQEARFLLKDKTDATYLIALDEGGDLLTSVAFQEMMIKARDTHYAEMRFVIGGADGLDTMILEQAHRKIAFGRITLPHMLARVILIEQIYRSITLIEGHPYHRI